MVFFKRFEWASTRSFLFFFLQFWKIFLMFSYWGISHFLPPRKLAFAGPQITFWMAKIPTSPPFIFLKNAICCPKLFFQTMNFERCYEDVGSCSIVRKKSPENFADTKMNSFLTGINASNPFSNDVFLRPGYFESLPTLFQRTKHCRI